MSFPLVARQLRRTLELGPRFVGPAELAQQITTNAGQQMVAMEGWLSRELVDEIEPSLRAVGHRHRDGAVELDDGRRHDLGEQAVQRDNGRPVRFFGPEGTSVAGG